MEHDPDNDDDHIEKRMIRRWYEKSRYPRCKFENDSDDDTDKMKDLEFERIKMLMIMDPVTI